MSQSRYALPALAAAIAVVSTLVARDAWSDEMRTMARCEGCTVQGVDRAEAALTGVDLRSASIRDTRFDQARLTIAVFDGATLERVSFDGADLGGASFVGARLIDVTFDGADLGGAVFDGAMLERTDLNVARLCKTQMPDDSMASEGCDR